jgi:hypothetical protein
MLAHIINFLASTCVGLATLKFCLLKANQTRRITKQNILNELYAHQCGRALALIKNIESASGRQKIKSGSLNEDRRGNGNSDLEATVDQITANITSYYQSRFSIQGTNCIETSTQQLIAAAYLLNADEDDPETGYFSYRIEPQSAWRSN